jgi:hypothetical protein
VATPKLACNQVILTPNKTVAEIHEATNNIVSHINDDVILRSFNG